MSIIENIPSSFRDPSGALFYYNNILYRKINYIYKENYDQLMNSGLYDFLCKNNFLIRHNEIILEEIQLTDTYKIIKPEIVEFISYPYEWSFSQLKHAAILTLNIQKIALNYSMSLKDCSAYNVQFKNGKPIFIDTLSFEKYEEGKPWVAYRQFCQHFLGPLSLMSFKDVRLNQLLRVHIDGIPLDLAHSILPQRTRFMFGLLLHIHLHARSQKKFQNKAIQKNKYKMSRSSLLGLIGNLESLINKINWIPKGTEWADYYEFTNYSDIAIKHKERVVSEIFDKFDPGVVLDLGSNDGHFSRLIAEKAKQVISLDVDPACVEKNYLECIRNNETKILPLLIDLTNPSSGIGWQNRERLPFFERVKADTVVALALVHHLAIANNVPLNDVAVFFHKICRFLIIEFVPKSDSQVKRLLSVRDDIFPCYTQQAFESAFMRHFVLRDTVKIEESERVLYFMERIEN
ncbi:MAG: class I SAM-dependent methyltransferase [Proteobacteria bacterium]|nr:class I SAM-dependent methyltransferase [Pseudomonadota bacterium]